jgi:hypothetical protein
MNCVVKVLVRAGKACGEMELELQSFLSLNLYEGGWAGSRPSRFTPRGSAPDIR